MNFKIGNVKLKNNIICAPLSGITDSPLRILMKKLGAGLVYSEMVSSEAIIRYNKKTLNMLKFTNQERPINIQLFGSEPEVIADAAVIVNEYCSPDMIDINMGCSVPKIIKNGAGAALLKEPQKIKRIIKITKNKCNLPLTIKIRSGWDKNSLNYMEIGKIAETEGAAAIALHARTATDKFKGKSNWTHIKNLKNTIKIPVIGNGDIVNYNNAKSILNFFDINYIMLGRVLLYNPWIILELRGNKKITITNDEKLKFIIKHITSLTEYYGTKTGLKKFRKHICYYTKGMRDGNNFRKKILVSNNYNETVNLITEYFNEQNY